LDSLGKDDLIRILTEPENALIKQYTALMETESVKLEFREDAIAEIAGMAALINERTENIGARRLYTIMERLLDEISFDASRQTSREENVNKRFHLAPLSFSGRPILAPRSVGAFSQEMVCAPGAV
jgi:ATP-dependent HslUV protease ATP-binding subunit HslU